MSHLVLERSDLCKNSVSLPVRDITLIDFITPMTVFYNCEKITFVDGDESKVLKNRKGAL